MKRFQGFIIGVIFMAIVGLTVPAVAATIEAVFNSVNITVNGNKIAAVGDSFVLANGDEVPFSILYKGTTYLPLRKMGEIFDKDIGWDDGSRTASVNDKGSAPVVSNPPVQPKTEFGLNETLVFDQLELTFGSNIQWSKLDNRYNKHNGEIVVKVPLKIKNISSQTHGLSSLYHSEYGSKGTKLDRANTFFDDSFEEMGKMRPGATQDTFFYLLYDGDGNYFIELNNYDDDKFTVKIPVNRTSSPATPSTPPLSSSVKMYSKFPTVPDFGAFINTELSIEIPSSDGKSHAYYYTVKFDSSKIDAYGDLLISLNFLPFGSIKSDGNNTALVYKNSNSNLSVMIGIVDVEFAIVVSTESISASSIPTRSTLEGKIKMYDKFPSVLDYGAFTNAVLLETTNYSFAYSCRFDKSANDKISDYVARLESLGFTLRSSTTDSSGNPMKHYINKDLCIVGLGWVKNASIPSFMITILVPKQ